MINKKKIFYQIYKYIKLKKITNFANLLNMNIIYLLL